MANRLKNRGVALLRRSTDRQEKSLSQQLAWARSKAAADGIELGMNESELQRMLSRGQHQHNGLFVDDAVSGSDLARPGLTALRQEVLRDRSISHVYIHMPDRFARPEEPLEAVMMELELRKAGVTIVFSNRVGLPRLRGVNDIADTIQLLFQYSEAGDYLYKLAQRVIEGQVQCAQAGGWTGGRAPYGFARVLVDSNGNEVQALEDGMRIRKEGCRVKIKPNDPDKIRIWVMILEWYHEETIGATKIAQRLNQLGIPSPDAGRDRTDNGVVHRVSGKWSARTVLTLIRNRAIIGFNSYGVQSEGKFRRLGENGPRLLEEPDLNAGKPKVVQNPRALVISRPMGFGPSVDSKLFEQCQKQLEERGQSQRGISRRKDPARYPLALRIWDMSDGCGHPMYALTSGDRPLYKCGRYLKTSGAECAHNAVDGEAALRFVLGTLRHEVDKFGGRQALRTELQKLAAAEARTPDKPEASAIQRLERALVQAESELQKIGRNLARANDDMEAQIIRAEFLKQKDVAQRLRQELESEQGKVTLQMENNPEHRLEQALALYDELATLRDSVEDRAALPGFFEKINLRLWMNFIEGRKGKRAVRLLEGGLLTTGDAKPPIRPYGNDGKSLGDSVVSGVSPEAEAVSETPSVSFSSRSEGVSFTMLNRGDRI